MSWLQLLASESAAFHRSRVSCQKGPTRHAYAWQIGPFWQDTLEVWGQPARCTLRIAASTIVEIKLSQPLLTLECTWWTPKGIPPLVDDAGKSQLNTHSFDDDSSILPFEIATQKAFSGENYYKSFVVTVKMIINLADGTRALHLMARCRYLLFQCKDKHNSLWTEMISLVVLYWSVAVPQI